MYKLVGYIHIMISPFFIPPKKEVLKRIFLLMQYGNKKCYIHKKTKFIVIPPFHYKLLFFLTLLKKTVSVTFLRSTAIWFIPSCIKKKWKSFPIMILNTSALIKKSDASPLRLSDTSNWMYRINNNCQKWAIIKSWNGNKMRE